MADDPAGLVSAYYEILQAGAESYVRIPIESVRPFRSNPYSGSGVFVHLVARL